MVLTIGDGLRALSFLSLKSFKKRALGFSLAVHPFWVVVQFLLWLVFGRGPISSFITPFGSSGFIISRSSDSRFRSDPTSPSPFFGALFHLSSGGL